MARQGGVDHAAEARAAQRPTHGSVRRSAVGSGACCWHREMVSTAWADTSPAGASSIARRSSRWRLSRAEANTWAAADPPNPVVNSTKRRWDKPCAARRVAPTSSRDTVCPAEGDLAPPVDRPEHFLYRLGQGGVAGGEHIEE